MNKKHNIIITIEKDFKLIRQNIKRKESEENIELLLDLIDIFTRVPDGMYNDRTNKKYFRKLKSMIKKYREELVEN